MKKIKAIKREEKSKKKIKMLVSGKSVFGIQRIIIEKARKIKKRQS